MLRNCFKALVSLCLFAQPSFQIQAQNLIANGNMEERNICTEYAKPCAPEAWFRYPPSSVQMPGKAPEAIEGAGYDLLIAENFTQRLYNSHILLYTRLLCPLLSGQQYRFSCYINPARLSSFELGVYVSAEKPHPETHNPLHQQPSFTLTEESVVKNEKFGWLKIEATFMANGGEEYLFLGNFNPKRLKLTEKERGNRLVIYYLIDDVNLIPLGNEEQPCSDLAQRRDSIYALDDRHGFRKKSEFLEEIDTAVVEVRETDPFHELDELEEEEPAPPPTVAPTPPVIAPEIKFVIPDIGFDFGKYDLKPTVDSMLETCARQIVATMPREVLIFGFTDDVGTDAYNLELSNNRANAVRNWFVEKKGLDPAVFQTKGMGESNPIASNETEGGRQANRRVEIKFN
jgi:outer membrane protein OmpA-like peptidoglycan-associated protein